MFSRSLEKGILPLAGRPNIDFPLIYDGAGAQVEGIISHTDNILCKAPRPVSTLSDPLLPHPRMAPKKLWGYSEI